MSSSAESERIKDEQRLTNLIKAFRKDRIKDPDAWIEFTRAQNNLNAAIKAAARCINDQGKRHPHQYRLKQEVLDATCTELLALKEKVKICKSFDELYKLIMSLDVFGLGPLTRYDIGTRLGAHMKLHPDRVYLHAGTRAGAEKLLGKISKSYLFKEDLPKPFREKDIQYWEIEDMLCVFKDRFKPDSGQVLIKRSKC